MTTTKQLDSVTYKLRPNPQKHSSAFYFTIAGGATPQWLFVNSVEMGSYQWITALMTSYSIQMKAGVTVASVIEQMKETFDPGGSYPLAGTNQQMASVVQHLGLILERHVAHFTTLEEVTE